MTMSEKDQQLAAAAIGALGELLARHALHEGRSVSSEAKEFKDLAATLESKFGVDDRERIHAARAEYLLASQRQLGLKHL